MGNGFTIDQFGNPLGISQKSLLNSSLLRDACHCRYCLKRLNLAPSASEWMNQIFDFEAWMADMVRYVQILDGSSVTGCPLPPRTKPRESVRKRHFHLQGVREVEYTKGTKGRPVQCCSGDKVPTATYRGKHPRVNRAGPDPADTPPPPNNETYLHRRDRGNHQTSGF